MGVRVYLEVVEVFLEHGKGGDVEIVGRLVEDEHLGWWIAGNGHS